jgi:hypothetical protein
MRTAERPTAVLREHWSARPARKLPALSTQRLMLLLPATKRLALAMSLGCWPDRYYRPMLHASCWNNQQPR